VTNNFFAELKRRNVRGAHAPSRAGDEALVITNFVSFRVDPTRMKASAT
jgi:hypothetical protein